MRSEDDFLNRSGPFLRTRCAVGFEDVSSFVGRDCETSLLFPFLGTFKDLGSQGVLEINTVSRKVEFGWVGVVCKYIATQDEPVSVELRSATLEEVARFADIVLLRISTLLQFYSLRLPTCFLGRYA